MNKIWKPTRLDLLLSIVITFSFPICAKFLFQYTGALVPMILYYALAWGVVKWRRGESGYHWKTNRKPPLFFFINLFVIIIAVILSFFARITVDQVSILGVLLTGLVWASINASSEQLLWIYIFEAFDLYNPSGQLKKWVRVVNRIIGLLLFSVFVGTIHTFFWVSFLHTVSSEMIVGVVFVVITSLSGYLHLIVWRKSQNMWFTFIPHFILNLFPLFWTGYSILPYLIQISASH